MLNKLSRKDIELLNILAQTPEGKSALNEYIEQHEKAVKAYKIYRESVVAEVEVDKVVKPVETKRKFKVGDKVRVLAKSPLVSLSILEVGDITEVVGYKRDFEDFALHEQLDRPVIVRDSAVNHGFFEESALELVEEKTPNELRAEIIQRAKEFVESATERGKSVDAPEVNDGHEYYRKRFFDVGFHVKNDKVTALIYLTNYTGRRFSRKPDLIGRAKCNSDDVFNADIGKAIALGRALGKDVSEFENAVQPTKVVVGQEVKTFDKRGEFHMNGKVKEVMWDEERISYYKEDYEKAFGFAYVYTSVSFGFKITDDTNAQYGGVE